MSFCVQFSGLINKLRILKKSYLSWQTFIIQTYIWSVFEVKKIYGVPMKPSELFFFKVACENIRFSSLFTAGDVSREGTSATQRQKFHTDDVKYVLNPVRSPDWSTE